MGKLDNMQDQMDNISREMEAIRKNQKAMLEMKKNHCNTNAFDRFISLHTPEEIISELEDSSMEASKIETQRENK